MAESADENTTNKQPSYYIGVGASAGGLEALQSMFSNMPDDLGVAFIVVQHLSPDFKSVMAELLSKVTTMNVFNTVDGVTIQPNTIYLIPPRKNMMIAEGKLLLAEQMPDQGLNLPIDIFFRSLAEDQRQRAIGIVLSGTGGDGSRGILAIKEVGGLVVVQKPESAKFDGMPASALRTGNVDLVLRAEEMHEKLAAYITNPIISGDVSAAADGDGEADNAMNSILELMRAAHKIDYSNYKPSTVGRRITQRMAINQMESLQDYYQLLLGDKRELDALSKGMLIGVTRFFRDADRWEYMKEKVIPDILDSCSEKDPIRVWIAGCSTGEESYSMAILIDEVMAERGDHRIVKVFATDVDPEAIAFATNGKYHGHLVDDISETRLRKYFDKVGEDFVIKPEIRQNVVFAVHDLIKDPPFSSTHLTLCRNVLIYFQPTVQRRVLQALLFSLKIKGVLFLGSSESLGDLGSQFTTINERFKFYRKSSDVRIPLSNEALFVSDRVGGVVPGPSVTQLESSRNKRPEKNTQLRYVTDGLLAKFVPPCIVLNEAGEVLHVYNDINPYTRKLQPGKFSPDIKNIIHEGLSVAVSTALHRCKSQNEEAYYQDVSFENEAGETIVLDLHVSSVEDPVQNDRYFVMILQPKSEEVLESTQPVVVTYNQATQNRQRILDLEDELKRAQENLQVTVEELETTNEELQSSNEELMVANEELQSTNEELQSVNEELYTVNSEYQEKIAELTRANADLDNMMRSTDLGIVFLDQALLVRSYTDAIQKHINLVVSDVGRPFHHISHNLEYRGLLDDVTKVLSSAEPMQKQVPCFGGTQVIVRITPYYTRDNSVQGVVLTLSDVSDLIGLKRRLKDSYEIMQSSIGFLGKPSDHAVRLLIVEDDAEDRLLICDQLNKIENQSYVVEEASDYAEAKSLLLENDYDICFVDYRLDCGKSALDLINALPPESPNKSFVVISGQIDDQLLGLADRLGIYDVLDKAHMSPQMLERIIRYIMRQIGTLTHLTNEDFIIAEDDILLGDS